MKKWLIKVACKPFKKDPRLSKKSILILEEALREYLENRLYDLEGLDFLEAKDPKNLPRIERFLSGLEIQKELIKMRKNL